MNALRTLAGQVRDGCYEVRRGAIPWATWPWAEKPRAIAIMMDRGTLTGGNRNLPGSDKATITLEIMARFINPESQELEEEVIDDVTSDAEWIVCELRAMRDANDDPIVFAVPDSSIDFMEVGDSAVGAEGIVVTMEVTY